MSTGKHFLAFLLTVNMAALSVPFPAGAAQEQTTVPEPYYEFTFDGETTGKQVENEGSKTGVFATLSGNGLGLGIVRDEARNSSVLNLPGGGLNQGCLTLPDNMFEDVTEEGFAFVAGAEDAKDLGNGQSGYYSSIMLPDRSAQLKLVWEEQFTHNAIGRSVYSTDNDLKAKVDEFRFYNTALTAEQAKAAYDSYAVSDSVLEELRGKVAEAEKRASASLQERATRFLRQRSRKERRELRILSPRRTCFGLRKI